MSQTTTSSHQHQTITIFSGGSAANSLVDVFESLRLSLSRSAALPCSLAYIIPISDNGGSSSELIRVFGGPGIGDVRSRLVRLIPSMPPSTEREAIGTLLSHRLSPEDGRAARDDWGEIVDGTSTLWKGISSAKKELIRSFFNLVNLEILKRSRPPGSTFDFISASVGNLFLTGARLFSGSFESAIYLLSAVCGIPDDEVKVIPSVNSNFSHHIAAGLEDGNIIVGQNAISHPSNTSVEPGLRSPGGGRLSVNGLVGFRNVNEEYHEPQQDQEEEEDAHPPFTLPTLRTKNITFSKAAHEQTELSSRISRIWYINPYGQEILPPANPRAISAITTAHAVIYSIGSLYTSIVPSLVLRGIGDAMRRSHAKTKILILNGSLDREVGPLVADQPFTAADFVEAIVRAGEQSRGISTEGTRQATTASLDQTSTDSDGSNQDGKPNRPTFQRAKSDGLGLTPKLYRPTPSKLFPPPLLASTVPSRATSPSPPRSPTHTPPFQPQPTLLPSLSTPPNPLYTAYITHIIHLPNSNGTPFVDRDLLASKYGIRCVKAYGRRHTSGMVYDPAALRGAIEAIVGGGAAKKVEVSVEREGQRRDRERERGRRNTVEL